MTAVETPVGTGSGELPVPTGTTDIAVPGVYGGISDADYHRHPALSSSGARALLPPSCPALFRHQQLHGRPAKKEFDFGHAAHAKVLGIGGELVVVQRTAKDGAKSDAADYKSPTAVEHADEIRAEGKVPVLRRQLEVVDAMADAIREHPVASVLFDPGLGGLPEQSAFWIDDRFGVERRARFDWLPGPRPDGRVIVPDYKTTTCAERGAFAKSVSSFGYHVQDVWYRDALHDLGQAEDVAFVFVAQEKTPPFLINVFQLDEGWLHIGRVQADRALQVFAECTATDTWPSYSSDVELITPPGWLVQQYEGALL
ncbi:PD-(D/E)XK nuclease-like domain-containing protein [Blastococcus sp. BMG 814]|uniref:PD-(D/E)XK nuclease-like domain-containing protein n=1 Tax=Blastococcus carthaginiensis TaxID=3050034 RepID=A0ABT9I992_9ACTN|nr:PD-(D/E)XK nuclease-like domain-containing protein [Blastococcus carthaginiensis]MDP5182141.1 PD-(D/E)XK nuclease-like domain-containing protein [Blastococcus carthaginiensis]